MKIRGINWDGMHLAGFADGVLRLFTLDDGVKLLELCGYEVKIKKEWTCYGGGRGEDCIEEIFVDGEPCDDVRDFDFPPEKLKLAFIHLLSLENKN